MRACVDCQGPLSKNPRAQRCKPCLGLFKRQTRPERLCRCGCGEALPHKEYVREYQASPTFLPGHYKQARGPQSPNWKGGRMLSVRGYMLIHRPDHPAADKDGYVYEHRAVYEDAHGVQLSRGQVVHHINHDKTDNRPENLVLLSSQAEHMSLHRKDQERKKREQKAEKK